MKPQNFLSFVMICPIIIGFVMADKCPPSPPLTKTIDYDLIKGNWLLAANKPEFDEKCKNLTFSVGENKKFHLHEELFMSTEDWRREVNDYDITKAPGTPYMILDNKASHTKVKLFLVDGNFCKYLIFYSCDDSTGSASDAWEIWTRGEMYDPATLPQPAKKTLNRLNMGPSNFSFTSANDCDH